LASKFAKIIAKAYFATGLMKKILKRSRLAFSALIILLFLIFLLSRGHSYGRAELDYGLTFSAKQAKALNLDWRQVYLSLFNELGVTKLRLPAYWDEVESSQGFNWQGLDWQLAQASEQGAEIILAVGGRLPRWPECHYPLWAKNLAEPQRQDRILNYISQVVERYKNNSVITAWQVENEPFLEHFGDCPKLDKDFLDREIALVRRLDGRPIVITDSGELSVWIPAARRADIFGTTMYRDTYSAHLKSYLHYPISPGFFRFKKNITRLFARPKDWLVIELQAEPWGPLPYQELSQAERERTMNPEKFRAMIDFSAKTGFKTFYLWGAEWWYWERVQGRPEIWEEAKRLFARP
jgi:hypothetical protein